MKQWLQLQLNLASNYS